MFEAPFRKSGCVKLAHHPRLFTVSVDSVIDSSQGYDVTYLTA